MTVAPLTQPAIDWLLSQGVSPRAIIKPTPIWAATGTRAEDGRFDEDPEGKQFLAFEEDHDLVFWQPRTDELATAEGRAFALGEKAIDNPGTTAFDRWLNIHANPLDWLRHGRDGVVVLRWEFAFDRLRYVDRIAVAEPLLTTYRRNMKPTNMPKLAVLPMAERIAS